MSAKDHQSTWLDRLTPAAAIAVVIACGCDIRISEQEARLRYDGAGDRLELLLIYKGVSATDPSENRVAGASELARRFLAGWRIISILGWPLSWDLDELEEELAASTPEDEAAFEHALLAGLLPDCVLEEAGGFLDDRERLSAYQLYRIEGFSRVVELWNRWASRQVLGAAADPERFSSETPLLDDRTRELWRLHAASGEPWILLADDGFAVELPMTAAAFERVREKIIEGTAAPDDGPYGPAALAQLLVYLTALEHGDERLVLEFRPARGIFAFAFWGDEGAYDPALRQALEAAGVAPDGTLDLGLVRSILPPDGDEGECPAAAVIQRGGRASTTSRAQVDAPPMAEASTSSPSSSAPPPARGRVSSPRRSPPGPGHHLGPPSR